jgi:hypothetical protein
MELAVQQLTETNFKKADWVCRGYIMSDTEMSDGRNRHISLYLPLVERAVAGKVSDSKVELDGQLFSVFTGTDDDGDEVHFITNGVVSTGLVGHEPEWAVDAPFVGATLVDLVEVLRNAE